MPACAVNEGEGRGIRPLFAVRGFGVGGQTHLSSCQRHGTREEDSAGVSEAGFPVELLGALRDDRAEAQEWPGALGGDYRL